MLCVQDRYFIGQAPISCQQWDLQIWELMYNLNWEFLCIPGLWGHQGWPVQDRADVSVPCHQSLVVLPLSLPSHSQLSSFSSSFSSHQEDASVSSSELASAGLLPGNPVDQITNMHICRIGTRFEKSMDKQLYYTFNYRLYLQQNLPHFRQVPS